MLGKKHKKDEKEEEKNKKGSESPLSKTVSAAAIPSPSHSKLEEDQRAEEERRKKQEEEEALRRAQEEERRRVLEETKRQAEEKERQRQAEEKERQRQAQEAERKRKEEEERRVREEKAREEKAKEERRREEEMQKQKAQEAAAALAAAEGAKVAAKKAASEVSEDVEIQSLESVKADPSDSKTVHREVYDLFPNEVYVAYDKLQGFARDLNTQIPVIEVALIGSKESGKSSLIEALLGRNITGTFSTKRPIFLMLINTLECELPRITLKRDAIMPEFNYDMEIQLDALPEALAARNKNFAEEPIFVHYEYRYCLNMTLIDTPGMGREAGPLVENIVLNIVRPSHRLILIAETAHEWAESQIGSFAKKVDPELSRTTFVCTKFYTQLQDFNNTRTVNRFLSGTMSDVKSFFVTIPSGRVRARYRETDKFQEKIWQAYRRDMTLLEQLQYDKRYERNIGVHALRRWLLNQAWRNYQEAIPRILKHLRARKHTAEKKLEEIQGQIAGLDSSKLRAVASNYVVNFLQIVEQLLSGTSEGHPHINGQTLEEEKSQQAEGDWLDSNNRPIRVRPEWGISYADAKLYGGQQFERLLTEFKAVSEHIEIAEVSMDDVATAAGINKLNNVPNYAWAASDLAQQQTQDALLPLIEQLCDRAVYVMKRLTDVAEKIGDSRRKKWQSSYRGNSHESNLEQGPYFTHHVKDLYFKFVDNTAKQCKEKCMDEFLSTRTIYWDLTEHPDRNLPINRNNPEDIKAGVMNLSTQLFTSLKQRITKNVLLKFYNFFLVPMQTDLWNEIQGKVNSLSDANLLQIFEIASTKEKLNADEKHLQVVLKKTAEQDAIFLDASTHFCHPIIINQISG